MNRDAQIYGGGIALVIITYLASNAVASKSISELLIGIGLVTGIGLTGKAVQNMKLKNKIQNYSQNNQGGINYSTNECIEIANEWARESFHNKLKKKKGLSFDWTQSSTEPASIYQFSNQEWVDVRCFYTPYGPQNMGIYVFIDATNGQHYASQPVKRSDMKQNPFEYLQSYKDTKRHASRITMNEDRNNFDGGMQALTGIPVQNFNPPSNQRDE